MTNLFLDIIFLHVKIYILFFRCYNNKTKEVKMFKIKAIKGNQADGVFYSGMICVKDIVNEDLCVVERLKQEDFADASPQRTLDSTAVGRIAKDIIKADVGKTGQTGGLATPTAVLLSCDQDLEYDEQRKEVIVPDGVVLSIMDGQHRVNGWKVALNKEQDNESLQNSMIAVTIIPAISPANKIWQFWSCNYLAKKPTQDQSLNLLAHAWKININGAFVPTAAEKKAEKREEVFNVVDFVQRINKSDASVWKNHIIMEGEKSERADNKTKMRAMVDVLRKYVFTEHSVNTAEYLWQSYWKVLKKLVQGSYPNSALFKSTGCEIFNVVYEPFMNTFTTEYGRDFTEANIEKLWKDIFSEMANEGCSFISAPEFWQSGIGVGEHKLENYSSRQPRGELIKVVLKTIKKHAEQLQPRE